MAGEVYIEGQKEPLSPEQYQITLAIRLIQIALKNGVDVYYVREELGKVGM